MIALPAGSVKVRLGVPKCPKSSHALGPALAPPAPPVSLLGAAPSPPELALPLPLDSSPPAPPPLAFAAPFRLPPHPTSAEPISNDDCPRNTRLVFMIERVFQTAATAASPAATHRNALENRGRVQCRRVCTVCQPNALPARAERSMALQRRRSSLLSSACTSSSSEACNSNCCPLCSGISQLSSAAVRAVPLHSRCSSLFAKCAGCA